MSERQRFRRRYARDRAEDDPGDARPIAAAAGRAAVDPERARRVRLRRRALVVGLGSLCLAGTVAALIGEGGLTDLRRLRLEMVDLRQEIERREATIRELEQEVRALEGDTLALERIAREQLGLVRPGEIDFLLPVQEGDPWAQAMPRRRLAGHP